MLGLKDVLDETGNEFDVNNETSDRETNNREDKVDMEQFDLSAFKVKHAYQVWRLFVEIYLERKQRN